MAESVPWDSFDAEGKTVSIIAKDQRLRWDYAAYLLIPPDRLRHEVMDGEHIANPAPNLEHQRISRRIQFQLYSQVELSGLGQVFNAPVDLQLSEFDIVQPDLVMVTTERHAIMKTAKIEGVPDLVIEILSPSNPEHDLTDKRSLYERAGIPEYWIVVPEEKQVLQLVMVDGKYTESMATTSIQMRVAPLATVDLTRVW